MRRSVPVFVLALAGLLGVGCQRDGLVPELITVSDLAPKIVDLADEMEIAGAGFPVKKNARITFHGALHRSGEAPESSVSIAAFGTSDNDQKITFTLTDDARARFLGDGAASPHATFDGDLEVSFPAITPGALPITGTLHDLHLDVRAKSFRKAARDARDEEGKRALDVVGLGVETDGRGGGLTVTRVAEGSPAEAGGLAVGDILTTMDGVSLIDLGDAIPTGKNRFAELKIVRVGEALPIERQVAIAGFRPKGSMDLVSVALILGIAAGIALFFASPLAGLLTRIERAIAARGKLGSSQKEPLFVRFLDGAASLFAVDLGRKKEHPLAALAPLVVFFLTSAAASALPFRAIPEVRDVDVLTTLLTLVIITVCLVFAAGGARSGARWSFVRALKASGMTILLFLPSVIAVAAVIVMAGSLRLVDLARAQGGLPWAFHLVRSPAAPVLFLALLFVAHADLVPAVSAVPEADIETPTLSSAGTLRAVAAAFAEWVTVYVLAALAAVLFLGGFELPGVDRALVEGDIGYGAAASLALLLKTWIVALLIVAARRGIPRLRWDQAAGALFRAVVPGSLGALALTIGFTYADPDAFTKRVIALVTTALVALLAVHLTRRANAARAGSVTHAPVSPFL